MSNQIKQMLDQHGLRHTRNRQQVLKVFLNESKIALSSADIEGRLDGMDRVTLYRTLKSFEQSGLIHQAYDETQTVKYALCGKDCSVVAHHDEHAHFHCEACGDTICLEEARIPSFKALGSYKVTSAKLMLSGYCDKCLAN
jgi:Fur family ferric uptake transcriptional regulator